MNEGRCHCGKIKIIAKGAPENIRICHCRLCQKTMGSPYFARALFRQDRITVSGQTERYPSSSTLDRVFCPSCGTTLGAWRKDESFAGIALAIFDDRNSFSPVEHVWYAERMNWIDIADSLPKHLHGKHWMTGKK